MGEGEAKGEVAGRWWLSRQPVKGRGQSTRLASLGAFQATELPFSSTEPPLAAIAADHRLSLITASSSMAMHDVDSTDEVLARAL